MQVDQKVLLLRSVVYNLLLSTGHVGVIFQTLVDTVLNTLLAQIKLLKYTDAN